MTRKSSKPTASARTRGRTTPGPAAGVVAPIEAAPSEAVVAPSEAVAAPTEAVVAPSEQPSVTFTSAFAELPVHHLLLRASGVVDENSVNGFFERISPILSSSNAKRVLVDLRDCKVVLSISDMHGLVKLAARAFSGVVDRLALVLKEGDILPEKFFEPALTSRGLPTFATTDYDEAVDWLAAKLRPGI